MSKDFNLKNRPPPVADKYRRETFNKRKSQTSESANKTEFSSEDYGLIYILKSKAGGLVKVGETMVNAESRLKSYTKEHDLEGFSVHSEYYVPKDQRQNIEKLTHKKLSKFRVRMGTSKEIFECSPEVARRALFDTFVELDVDHEHFESEIKKVIDSIKKEQEKKQKIEDEKRRVEEEKRRVEQQEYQEKMKIEQQEKRSVFAHYCLFFGFGIFFLMLFGVINGDNGVAQLLTIGSIILGLLLL